MKRSYFILGLFLTGAAGLPACSRHSQSAAVLYYRNPMNPSVTSSVPMKDEMGMDYIPVYANENQAAAPVPGRATIRMAPGVDQEIGVTVATAAVRDLVFPVRAAARVAYDPPLYNATLEHREAAAFALQARREGTPDLREQAQATLQSSRLRLRQMGLSDDQIADVEKPAYDPSSLLLGSQGGRAWVYADVYDNEANLIHPGQGVELTSPAMPGQTFYGTVRSIDPILNSDTRTLRVRIEVLHSPSPLRPETYVSATIHAELGRHLAVPEGAVLDTGTRQLVYVLKDQGTYEPREVRLGRRAGGYYEILAGLAPGEKVSASANFLIDSESRIEASAPETAQHPAP